MKYFLSILTIFFLFSCSNNVSNQKSENKQDTIKKEIKEENKEYVFPELSDTNVVVFLTEYGSENTENKIKITTDYGDMIFKLYDETPLHRASFIMLIKRKYFNGSMFYRVVNNLVIQGGDSDEKGFSKRKKDIGYYTIPQEFNSKYLNKKGSIALSREYENNPDKRSSPYDFFINHKNNTHLNYEHTVFGEMLEGFDVLDSIANQRTDESEWPINNIYIKMEVLE